MIHPIMVAIFLLVGFAAAGMGFIWLMEKATRWIRIRRARIQAKKELAAEEARQAALPKLDTRYLIRMPDWAVFKYYGAEDHRPRKAFGTRYCHLIVFDEVGDVWLGLFMPETLRSLRDCEFSRGDFWVWFRGPGEAFGGAPLEIDGIRIDGYPVWMEAGDAHPDEPQLRSKEWRLWVELEQEFEKGFNGISPVRVFEALLPWDVTNKAAASKQLVADLRRQLGR